MLTRGRAGSMMEQFKESTLATLEDQAVIERYRRNFWADVQITVGPSDSETGWHSSGTFPDRPGVKEGRRRRRRSMHLKGNLFSINWQWITMNNMGAGTQTVFLGFLSRPQAWLMRKCSGFVMSIWKSSHPCPSRKFLYPTRSGSQKTQSMAALLLQDHSWWNLRRDDRKIVSWVLRRNCAHALVIPMAGLDLGLLVPKRRQQLMVMAAVTMATMTRVSMVVMNMAMDRAGKRIKWLPM